MRSKSDPTTGDGAPIVPPEQELMEASGDPTDASSSQDTTTTTDSSTPTAVSPMDKTRNETTKATFKFSFGRFVFRCGSLFIKAASLVIQAITFLVKLCTFSNLFKVFLLSLFFQGFNLDPGALDSSSEPNYQGQVQQPNIMQHFALEPTGYTYASSRVPYNPIVNAAENDDGKTKKVPTRKIVGYYGNDQSALEQALAATPVYYQELSKEEDQFALDNATSPLSTPNTTVVTAIPYQDDEFSDVKDFAASNQTQVPPPSPTVIVLDMKLDTDPIKQAKFLQQVATFFIGQVRDGRVLKHGLVVVVVLDAAGGSVRSYGFMAEQLRRLRTEPGITLTVSCDLMAASGGYMMASLATPGHLLAAPFSMIGSIGVVSNLGLDLSTVFETYGIREVQVKSGARKLGDLAGGVTEQELQYLQENADSTHKAFREYVKQWRGDVIRDYDFVSSGDTWLGTEALELGLVDKLITSEEYIDKKVKEGCQVLKLKAAPENNAGMLSGAGIMIIILKLLKVFLGGASTSTQVLFDGNGLGDENGHVSSLVRHFLKLTRA